MYGLPLSLASWNNCTGGGGGTPGNAWSGCAAYIASSPSPDPISDQNLRFSKPVFRPHAVTSKIHARFQPKKAQRPYPLGRHITI